MLFIGYRWLDDRIAIRGIFLVVGPVTYYPGDVFYCIIRKQGISGPLYGYLRHIHRSRGLFSRRVASIHWSIPPVVSGIQSGSRREFYFAKAVSTPPYLWLSNRPDQYGPSGISRRIPSLSRWVWHPGLGTEAVQHICCSAVQYRTVLGVWHTQDHGKRGELLRRSASPAWLHEDHGSGVTYPFVYEDIAIPIAPGFIYR